MAMVLFGYIVCSMILPLKISWKYKAAMALAIFVIAQKNGILRRIGGGLFFSPEVPRWILILIAFLYGILFFCAAFLLFKDIFCIGLWKILAYRKIVNQKFPCGLASAVILGIAIILSAYSLYEGLSVAPVKYVEMKFDRLPAEFDGFKIAVLADLHASAINQSPFIDRTVELTLQEKPDLIVLPGDIIDGRVAKRMADVEPLRKLTAPYGVFGCLGNHEYYSGYDEWMQKFADLQLPILINSHVRITKNDKAIYLGGIADYSAAKRGKEAPDLQKTWADVPAEAFKILLSHQPKNNELHAASGVDLQISGHTHGGMIIGMDKLLIAPSNSGVVRGEYDIDNMKLYISAGASLWSGFPLRLGVPPEITIIILRTK